MPRVFTILPGGCFASLSRTRRDSVIEENRGEGFRSRCREYFDPAKRMLRFAQHDKAGIPSSRKIGAKAFGRDVASIYDPARRMLRFAQHDKGDSVIEEMGAKAFGRDVASLFDPARRMLRFAQQDKA